MASGASLIRGSRKILARISEELLPPPFFWVYYRKKVKVAKGLGDFAAPCGEGKYKRYWSLSNQQLSDRLCEEHERGRAIDEKTLRFTFVISIGLTVLGAAAGYLTKVLENDSLKYVVVSAAGISVLYTITGGLLALGALKTLPRYGYGTQFLLWEDQKLAKVRALAAQEELNIVRHLRNEAAYQCIRNGFAALLFLVCVFFISLVWCSS